MAQVTISLPDDLAQDAQKAGLFVSGKIEAILRECLRDDRIKRLQAWLAQVDTDPFDPMSPEEIDTMIAEVRAEMRAERTASQAR